MYELNYLLNYILVKKTEKFEYYFYAFLVAKSMYVGTQWSFQGLHKSN